MIHSSASSSPVRLRLRVEDYLVLNDAGALAEAQRTELIDGEILVLAPRYRREAVARMAIASEIQRALDRANAPLKLLAGVSIAMPPHDVPQVDIVLMSTVAGDGLVPLASVAMIVEVADVAVDYDLQVKAAVYARHGVPEYWVVDLNAAHFIRMWQPGATGFAQADAVPFGTPITAATLPGLTVSTDGLD